MTFDELGSGARFSVVLDQAKFPVLRGFLAEIITNDFIKLSTDFRWTASKAKGGSPREKDAICLDGGTPCQFPPGLEVVEKSLSS